MNDSVTEISYHLRIVAAESLATLGHLFLRLRWDWMAYNLYGTAAKLKRGN